MQTLNLLQGTPEWSAHRAAHFNASDAPSMLGISKYKTRNQLLCEIATGIMPEIDAATQRRFDDGHRFEALARPLAETIIGEDLSPIVGTEGKLSASFDGITFDNLICFEHKTLNDNIRSALSAGTIPAEYCAQMEQQLMISGATKCLFMASKWDGDELVEDLHCWYESNQDMRNNLLQGWTQFAIDLENYVHIEHAEKPSAAPIIGLPALFAQVEGSFNLSTNIVSFSSELKAFVGRMDLSPTDDQGFSDLEAQVKVCAQAEDSIKAQVLGARGQMVSFDEFCKTADLLLAIASRARIDGTNAIKEKKVAIKAKAIADAKALFAAYVAGLEAEIYPIRLVVEQPDFVAETKGLKGLKSLHNEIDTALANGKIKADAVAKDIRVKRMWFSGEFDEYEFLFRDMQSLVAKPIDDFKLAITARIDTHKAAEAAKMEAERARIQKEEEAKAKAAQDALLATERAKMEAEVRAKAEAEAKAQRVLDDLENETLAQQEAAAAIEERRKQAQLDAQAQPFKLSGAKTAVAQAITPRRPNRAELLDAVATTFGTTNEAALDWILQEFRADIKFAAKAAA